jgi:hypothetical protein
MVVSVSQRIMATLRRTQSVVKTPLANIAVLRRELSTDERSKQEKQALIMRLRQKEEETKKYGAPLGQVCASDCVSCHPHAVPQV